MERKTDITEYVVKAPVDGEITAAVIADIHGSPWEHLISAVKEAGTDVILIPGDVTKGHMPDAPGTCDFFAAAAAAAPVFMSLGNHERMSHARVKEAAAASGVTILDDSSAEFRGLTIGGLTSGYVYEEGPMKQAHLRKTPPPDLLWAERFAALPGFKVLLSHHPEYYPAYLRDLDIDLIISGHAHGGQWRIFGHPFFAPGQGFFPEYAQGMTDGRLIVSRGLANNGPAPRFGNRPELVFIKFRNDA